MTQTVPARATSRAVARSATLHRLALLLWSLPLAALVLWVLA